MGRAGSLAGGGSALGDGIGAGNSLGVFFVRGFPLGKLLVVFIIDFDGADLGALAAAGAFGNINIAGFLADAGFKIAGISVKG
jgi:hypothetical protein